MDDLGRLYDQYQFPPQLIYNFDETMLEPGDPHTKVITKSASPRPFLEIATKGEHISLGLAISAAGNYMKPLLILPLVYLPELPEAVKQFFWIGGQENGFISNEIWHDYHVKEFIPKVEAMRAQLGMPNQPALYLVDPHVTRAFQPTIKEFNNHRIIVKCFLSHSSTVSQPLDLQPHEVLKRALRQYFKPVPNEPLPEKRQRLLTTSVYCLQMALNALPIMRGTPPPLFFLL